VSSLAPPETKSIPAAVIEASTRFDRSRISTPLPWFPVGLKLKGPGMGPTPLVRRVVTVEAIGEPAREVGMERQLEPRGRVIAAAVVPPTASTTRSTAVREVLVQIGPLASLIDLLGDVLR
jgi:hypothetical protein